MDVRREWFQGFILPGLPGRGGFEDEVFDSREKFRALKFQPVQNVRREFAIMRASLDDPQFAIRNSQFREPLGELKCEQLPEEFAGADAGNKVAGAADIVLVRFVVASFGTVKGEFHETRKADDAIFSNFFADNFNGHFHCLQSGMALASVASTESFYG